MKFELMAVWEAADVSTNKLNQNVLLFDLIPKTEKTEAIEIAKELVESVGLETQMVVAAFFVAGKTTENMHPRLRMVCRDYNDAYRIRFEGLKKRREGLEPWKSIFITNDSTKATRVRVEILKKIAERIEKDSVAKDFELIINKFDTRPMLMFKKNGKVVKRIPYPEAIKKWGNRLLDEDLEQPRKIAGRELGNRFHIMFGI